MAAYLISYKSRVKKEHYCHLNPFPELGIEDGMIGINNLPSTIKQLSQSTIECKTTDSEVSPPTDCSEGPTLRVLIAVKMMAGGPLFPPSNKL